MSKLANREVVDQLRGAGRGLLALLAPADQLMDIRCAMDAVK
ncbi:MAG: hypothetical protein ABFC96_06815 [Thermoguttaceae bacterium]